MTQNAPRKLSAIDVRFRADLAPLDVETTDTLNPSTGTVGQPEALEALQLGLTLRAPGYNIYLAGIRGTGRFAAIREMISHLNLACPVVKSHSYVHNLNDSERPILISLPRGMGKAFQQALERVQITRRAMEVATERLRDHEAEILLDS